MAIAKCTCIQTNNHIVTSEFYLIEWNCRYCKCRFRPNITSISIRARAFYDQNFESILIRFAVFRGVWSLDLFSYSFINIRSFRCNKNYIISNGIRFILAFLEVRWSAMMKLPHTTTFCLVIVSYVDA